MSPHSAEPVPYLSGVRLYICTVQREIAFCLESLFLSLEKLSGLLFPQIILNWVDLRKVSA